MTSKLAALCLGLAVTAGAYKVGSQAEPVVPHLDETQPEVGPPPDTTIGSILPLCCAECQCRPTCKCSAAKECLTPRAGTPATAPPEPPQTPASNEARGVSYTTAPAVQLEWLPWVNQHGQYIGHRWTHPSTPRMPYRPQPVQAAPTYRVPQYQPQRFNIFGRPRSNGRWCPSGGC